MHNNFCRPCKLLNAPKPIDLSVSIYEMLRVVNFGKAGKTLNEENKQIEFIHLDC